MTDSTSSGANPRAEVGGESWQKPARLPATFAALAVLVSFLANPNREWQSAVGLAVVVFVAFAAYLWIRTSGRERG